MMTQEALEKLLNRIDTLPWRSNRGWTSLETNVWREWLNHEVREAREVARSTHQRAILIGGIVALIVSTIVSTFLYFALPIIAR